MAIAAFRGAVGTLDKADALLSVLASGVGLGVGWFLIVRWKTPAILEQIEKDLEGATPAAAE